MQPKVSILIPCYNAERWIAQAIESALSQTYPDQEIIVVDDGSTDNSLAIIREFEDKIFWETGPNRGGNVARNRLLELSNGEWLQYLDADDYLLPDKVEKQVCYLSEVPRTDILYSPSIFKHYQVNGSSQEVLPIPEPFDPWILLARWFLPQTGSPLWRKQALLDVGGWKPEQPCCQEHELYLRLLMAGKTFEYFSEAGSVYRQWSEETICKRDKPEVLRQRLAIETKLEKHLETVNLLTADRQSAINQARFECARKIWLEDPLWAKRLVRQIHKQQRTFSPGGAAAPVVYQWIYKILGFDIAEKVAMFRRKNLNKVFL